LTSSVFLVTSFFLVSATSAKSENSERGNSKFVTAGLESPDPSETPEASSTAKPRGHDKLEANRLHVCEIKEKEINNRAGSLLKLVTVMIGKFDSIALRVEGYYLGSGKQVPNYQALVDDIAAKKAAAWAALVVAQNDATGFSCTGEDPKGQLTQFRIDMQAVKMELHAYRTSIKNLIVAVRGVVKSDEDGLGQAENGSGTPTSTNKATPTGTPTESPTPTPTATPTPEPL